MNQGTRIVVAILVILIIVTGLYWMTAGPSRASKPESAPGSSTETGTETPASPERTPRTAPTNAPTNRPVNAPGSAARTPPTRPPAIPASGESARPATPTGTDRLALGGGTGGASTPPAGNASSPPVASGNRPVPEVGGKGDGADLPDFIRKPVGLLPSLANVPAGFVPAEPRGTGSGATPSGEGVRGPTSAPATPPTTPPATPGAARDTAAPPRGALPREAAVVDEYVIQDGDTLVSIADMWFGDGRQWERILAANEGVDPRRLAIGQRLALPPRGTASSPAGPSGRPAAPGARPAAPTGPDVHVVAEGDTLYSIARARLGDGQRWQALYEANRAAIGADPAALKPGMTLRLPRN